MQVDEEASQGEADKTVDGMQFIGEENQIIPPEKPLILAKEIQ